MTMQTAERSWRYLSQEHEFEVRWYYCDSGSLMRLKCNLGAHLQRAADGLAPQPDDYYDPDAVDRQHELAQRFGRVSHALRVVGHAHEMVLRALTAEESYLSLAQRKDIKDLGALKAVLLLAPSLARWAENKGHTSGSTQALQALQIASRKRDPGIASLFSRVRIEAEGLARAAGTAYAEAVR